MEKNAAVHIFRTGPIKNIAFSDRIDQSKFPNHLTMSIPCTFGRREVKCIHIVHSQYKSEHKNNNAM